MQSKNTNIFVDNKSYGAIQNIIIIDLGLLLDRSNTIIFRTIASFIILKAKEKYKTINYLWVNMLREYSQVALGYFNSQSHGKTYGKVVVNDLGA